MLEFLGKLIDPSALTRAQVLSKQLGEPLDAVCTRLGLCAEADLVEHLSRALDVAPISAAQFPAAAVLSDQLNSTFLRTARAIPVACDGNLVELAMVDPTAKDTLRAIAFATELPVEPRVCSGTDFEAGWTRLFGGGKEASSTADANADLNDLERLADLSSDAPVIRYVNQLVSRAVDMQASDIHIEPNDQIYQVRFRLDGLLRRIENQTWAFGEAVVSRVKIMARLNIAERRLAQDGRFRVSARGQDVDLRVATTPTVRGEAVVLRILDSDSVPLDLNSLGLAPAIVSRWNRLLDRPHGIVLVTGPTGSGKSTTLYASLARLNRSDRKLLTIEDPVERQIPGVNQVHAQPAIGFGFSAALRAFLRHDPDIVMVGEIRDHETARTAIQAALTGHLILSTLHTNDAVLGITRLLDMGIDDYLISSTLLGILAQRLVRKLCTTCRGEPGRQTSCQSCGGAGYAGRTTIGELLVVTPALRSLIEQRAGYEQLRSQALDDGMVPLATDGADKVAAGITTIEEIARATMDSS